MEVAAKKWETTKYFKNIFKFLRVGSEMTPAGTARVKEHLNHLQRLLCILSKYNFQLNPPKCKLFHQKIDYLSHIISEAGFQPNNERIQPIMNLREPSNYVSRSE